MVRKGKMRLSQGCIVFALVAASLAGCREGQGLFAFGGSDETTPLTNQQARQWATSLANQEFMKTRFVNAAGKRVLVLVGSPDWDSPSKLFGRWRFELHRSPGPWAKASFRLDGSDPKVKVGYNTR